MEFIGDLYVMGTRFGMYRSQEMLIIEEARKRATVCNLEMSNPNDLISMRDSEAVPLLCFSGLRVQGECLGDSAELLALSPPLPIPFTSRERE